MRFLRKYNENKELVDLFDKLSHLLTVMRQEVKRQNRNQVCDKNPRPGLDQEYKDYFYDFIDDGWKIGLNPGLHVSVIFISKTFDDNYDSEDILNEINPILQSIKKKFVDDGFNTHYQILFNGVAQCEVNPKTNKTDIYLYKGDWDDELSRYYEKGKLSVKINFFFI